jgi:bacillithiol biosynthesis cysteine-adding enzyme BshC
MSTALDYFFQNGPKAQSLFPSSFLEPAHRTAKVAEACARGAAPQVLESLKAQNAGSSSVPFLDGRPLAFVVTGQQLGVVGGPLFTFYKIASAIRAAETLSAESGKVVLPLFWLQSEDHDYAEIRNTSFLTREGEKTDFSLPENPPGLGGPVGRISISPESAASLKAFLENTFSGRAPAERIDEILASYASGRTLAQAMAALVKLCFQDTPLLVLDAHTQELKQFAAPHLLRFFTEHSAIQKILEDRSAQLTKLGIDITVPLRKGYPLPFLEVQGKRERVLFDSDLFKSSSGSFSTEELSNQILRNPELCTTSALARPLYQDFLLPTAAYVAGPTEFNYWAQLPGLYEHLRIPMPVVIPRGKFAVLPENRAKILSEENLSLMDARLPLQKLIEQRVAGSAESPEAVFGIAEGHLASLEADLGLAFARLGNKVVSESLSVTAQAMKHNLDKLRAKYLRALTDRHQTFSQRAEKLQKLLLPGGDEQERTISFAHFFLLEGPSFTQRVLSALSLPFPRELQLLTVPSESKGVPS